MRVPKNSSNRNPQYPQKVRAKTHHDSENCPRTRTAGEVFRDGASINLLCEPETGSLSLLLCEGGKRRVAREIEFRGSVYTPINISRSVLQAMSLPSDCGQFEKTGELFADARGLFTSLGFPKDIASSTTYFGFATWFTKFLPAAPCLLIAGPRPEVAFLLELLACLVHHPLPLGDVTRAGLCSLPMHLEPTLLIDQQRISRSTWGLLGSSNRHTANVPRREGLVNIFCAKAISCEGRVDSENFGDGTLQINVPPSRGRLPTLLATEKDEIAKRFQSRFLAYHARSICKVRDSQCDFPEFDSRIRILGRVLGAPIVDAPELQADLDPLLSNYHDGVRASKWLDLPCVTIEAALFHCHKEVGGKVHVGEIAKTVNATLNGRGEPTEFEAKVIGGILGSLGLVAKRDGQGYAIRLDEKARRFIHELARRFDVAAAQEKITLCPLCIEILATNNTGSKPL